MEQKIIYNKFKAKTQISQQKTNPSLGLELELTLRVWIKPIILFFYKLTYVLKENDIKNKPIILC